MKNILFLSLILISGISFAQIGPNDAGSLMGMPSTLLISQMVAVVNPQIGSCLYVVEDESIYVYTSNGPTSGWQKQGSNEHSGTTGSVFFADTAGNNGEPTEDNTNFFWDDANNRLGIGTDSPDVPLHLVGNTGAAGILRLEGTEPDIVFNDTNGGFNTFTFRNAGVNKAAIGRKIDDSFYITINNGGWNDNAFTINNTTTNVGIGVAVADEKLDVNGRIKVRTLDAGANTDEIVVAGTDGILKKVTSASIDQDADEVDTVASTIDLNGDTVVDAADIIDTDGDGVVETTSQQVFEAITPITSKAGRVFYPPSIEIDASSTGSKPDIDLYAQYTAQYGATIPANQRSIGAPDNIPVYTAAELYYYVTYADPTIFTINSISATGVLSYDIIGVPNNDNTIINVVFVVK